MMPSSFLRDVIDPACGLLDLIYKIPANDKARAMMLAIARQESGLNHRRQIGPTGYLPHLARGFWQFEKGGGVAGVLAHERSKEAAEYVCAEWCIPHDQDSVHEAIAWNDRLSASFARLLLWTDEKPLPELGDEQGAWDCYVRNWRPGKPKRDAWTKHYAVALACVRSPSPAPEPKPVEQTPAPVAAPVATATVVVPSPKPDDPETRFATAPGKHSTEFMVAGAGLLLEFGLPLLERWTSTPLADASPWPIVIAYIAGRTLVKVAAELRKSPTVVVAKK
jgi:hypothetical protein